MFPFAVRLLLAAGGVGLLAAVAWLGEARADEGRPLKEGDLAPMLELPATQIGAVLPEQKEASILKLADLKGKKHVVLWFFPKALTGG